MKDLLIKLQGVINSLERTANCSDNIYTKQLIDMDLEELKNIQRELAFPGHAKTLNYANSKEQG